MKYSTTPKVWVTDLEDLRTSSGDFAGGPGSFAAFLGRLVEAASARSEARWSRTAVPCAVRARGKRRCSGHVEVRGAPAAVVEWRCPACQSRGTISGWHGGPEDLRGARDHRPAGDRIAVSVSGDQYRALAEAMAVWVDNAEITAAATHDPTSNEVVLAGTADELDALCDAIAGDANHAESRKVQKLLDGAYHRITGALKRSATPDTVEGTTGRPVESITAEAVADRVADLLGMKAEAAAPFKDLLLGVTTRLVEAEKLIARIRKVAAACRGKPALVQTVDLAGVLDQAATFARSEPARGVSVLAAFVSALRTTSLDELDGLVLDAGIAMLACARQARDSRATTEALAALVVAHVHDPRFGGVKAAIERAHLGKRARKAALDVLAHAAADRGEPRRRAAELQRVLAGDPVS